MTPPSDDLATYRRINLPDKTLFLLPKRKFDPVSITASCIYFALLILVMIEGVSMLMNFRWQGIVASKVLFIPAIAVVPLLAGTTRRMFIVPISITVGKESIAILPPRPGKPQGPIRRSSIARLELELSRSFLLRLGYGNCQLVAEHFDGTRTTIASDYPPEFLEKLAADLQSILSTPPLESATEANATPTNSAEVAISDVSTIPEIERNVLSQPANSKITYSPAEDLHTFYIPRWGMFRKPINFAAFMLFLSLNLAYYAYLTSIGINFLLHPKPGADIPRLVALLALVLFTLAVALALMIAATHSFTRKTILIIKLGHDGEISIINKSLLFKRQRHFARTDLRTVSTRFNFWTKHNYLENKDKPLVLLIFPTHGGKHTIFVGTQLETRWLATQLRRLLNLPRQ